MSEITLEVILRTVIGASDPTRLAALRQVMPRLLNLGPFATLAIAGAGLQRGCLGATFAMVEMRVVLREVLRRVELCTTTAAAERQTVKHVILVPHRGARIRVRAIRKAATASVSEAQTPTCPVAEPRS